jgi:hypothetical protein
MNNWFGKLFYFCRILKTFSFMLLFTRKLLFLFFLSSISFSSLKSQIGLPGLPIGIITMIANKKAPTIKLFRSCKFDSSAAIIGIDFTDSTNGRNGQFSFIINNTQGLDELKKNWVFKEATDKSDTGIFKVFYTSNKVIKGRWVIFPKTFTIVTTEGLYRIDSSMLSTLHQKSPLVHSTRTDTLKGKSEYLRFSDSVKTKPAFLFIMESDLVCDGSFEVTLKADSHILPEEVGERIINSCNKIKGESAFKVYLKQDEGAEDAKRKTYVVKCDRSLFEQFSDRNFEKANWAPATYVIQSFWRSL